ncbi:glycosyltransferase [Flagellimonas beolgyonensis]|jgi:hypothetical protein|uniref:glycosyltransferase n=1 Tax=Flagellimonas beolgyonensis TaxID=864064 RepID=UPI000F8C4B3C|nr:glycosyltransferase family 4 protein [Allomuricauda beolgyonensis]
MKKLFVIGFVWPEPSTTAAGSRMQQLLETFKTFGYQITFASTATKTEYSMDLEQLGIEEATIELNNPSFDTFVQALQPDVVVFDRFMVEEQFGWRVAEFAPQAIRVLNTEDLHALRKAREEALNKEVDFTLNGWKNHPMTLREVASIYRSDLTLMVSSFEEVLLKELGIPDQFLLHLPLFFDAISTKEKAIWPDFNTRIDFVTLGNGKHAPNVDALRVLKTNIWPQVRQQLPKAQLHVYGAYLPQHVYEWNDPNTGFLVHGWAEDISDILRSARVLLAPLRFGAGIKGKLLDALRNGTPSVTTKIGAEGMFNDKNWGGRVADNWADFAHAAVQFYTDQKLWERAHAEGIRTFNEHFDKVTHQKKLGERLKYLMDNLDAHRTENFMGRLLQHQTLTSTKYMAKWIEAKNKKP